MEDIRDGVNHLIVTGKGNLQDRDVLPCMPGRMGVLKRLSITPDWMRLSRSTRTHPLRQINWKTSHLIS
ncbi:MAG: hypothetical protein V8S01_02275 [Dorea sp.]